MLSIWRVETLDTWDVVMNVNIFGCHNMPGAYPFTDTDTCVDGRAYGWIAAAYFVFLVVIGGLVLPTVLIGIIAIAFEQSSRKHREKVEEELKTKHVRKLYF